MPPGVPFIAMKKKTLIIFTVLVVPGGIFILTFWGLARYFRKSSLKNPFLGV